MPRVPTYEPNRVAPASTTGARFQAARDPGSIGDGLANFGKSLNDFAVMQDKIDEQFDDTVSRKLTLEYQTRAAQIRSQFEQQEGLNAVGARTQTDAELAKVRDEIFGKATTPRMKLMLEERVSGYYAADSIKVGEHAQKQMRVETRNTMEAQAKMAREGVFENWDRPDLAQQYLATGLAVIDDMQKEYGWSNEVAAQKREEYESGTHRGVVENFLAQVIPDVDGASAYFEAHRDKLNLNDELALGNALQKPLQDRKFLDNYTRAIGIVEGEPGKVIEPPSKFTAPFDGFGTIAVTGRIGDARGKRSHNGEDFPMPVGTPIKAPSEARVISTSPSASGGKQVIIEFGNGDKMGVAHLSGVNVKVGDTVKAGQVIALSGNTGKSTGPHAHMTTTLATGEKVSPSEYFKKAPTSVNAPRRWDKADVYSKIDALAEKEGWGYEEVEGTKRRADTEIGRDEQLIARREDDADRRASAIVIGLGDKFTSLSQLPSDVVQNLTPEARARYEDVTVRNTEPKAAPANGRTALELNLQAINDPEGFKELSLGQYVGQVTPSEFESFVVKQATMRKEKPGAFNPRSGIQSAITWGKKYGGVDVADEDFVKVYDIMEAELRQRYQSTNKAPTDAEYEAAFRSATREVKTVKKGILWDSEGAIPRYKLEVDNIPAKDRVKVEQRFKSIYGRAPNEEELGNAYRLGKGQYW